MLLSCTDLREKNPQLHGTTRQSHCLRLNWLYMKEETSTHQIIQLWDLVVSMAQKQSSLQHRLKNKLSQSLVEPRPRHLTCHLYIPASKDTTPTSLYKFFDVIIGDFNGHHIALSFSNGWEKCSRRRLRHSKRPNTNMNCKSHNISSQYLQCCSHPCTGQQSPP